MFLPVHRQYEIIFLSQHSMGSKPSHAAVAKAVKCDMTTVRYWLERWKQTKDWSDSIRLGRTQATTLKQDEQIISLVEQQTLVTARDIAHNLRKTGATVNEKMIQRRLNEAAAKYNQPLSKPWRLLKYIERIV